MVAQTQKTFVMTTQELEQLVELLHKYAQSTNSPMILESIYPFLKQTEEHLDLKKKWL
jgi:hypothetical protein